MRRDRLVLSLAVALTLGAGGAAHARTPPSDDLAATVAAAAERANPHVIEWRRHLH